jgi:predicted transcriptional regulator YdeE
MPKAWDTLRGRLAEIPNRNDAPLVDICLDRDGEHYVQVVGAEVSSVDTVPEGMVAIEIPTQQYIWYRHTGELQEIADSFGAIYEFSKRNGYLADEFKLDIGYTPDSSIQPHDLYVRVKDAG